MSRGGSNPVMKVAHAPDLTPPIALVQHALQGEEAVSRSAGGAVGTMQDGTRTRVHVHRRGRARTGVPRFAQHDAIHAARTRRKLNTDHAGARVVGEGDAHRVVGSD